MKEKNKYGQYFTIPEIASFMVNLISHGKHSRVLEPSCGKGVFLTELAKKGFTNVTAYEIDRCLATEFENVKHESFISSPLEIYDVVIGNPPYIRWKNIEPDLKDELNKSHLWNKYFNSLCDYLFIFILKSIEQLSENGELIFICTDYWMNTTNSSTLRNYMVQNGYFSEIYHFKETPLFEGVTASLMIFRYIKSKNSKNRSAEIALFNYDSKRKSPELASLLQKSCFKKFEIPQFRANERWVLATKAAQEQLSEFEHSCIKKECGNLFGGGVQINKIGDFCDIGNGMVSGMDKAFNIGDVESLTSTESKAIIKVLKAKDLMPFGHKNESRYFFLQEKISENDFETNYPNIAKHISKYKQTLMKRYDYGNGTPYWEFVFPRNLRLFNRKEKRIFVPCKERISNKDHFRFSLADEEFMPLQDVTGIFKKKNCKESIEYITAYLNNPRIFEWLKFNGIIKGYIVEFSEAPIASIPYRPINWNNKQETIIHDNITTYVEEFTRTGNSNMINMINECFDKLFSNE